jgi:hypothetical protein
MPVYQIHDVSFNETYDCPDDVLILDRAEEIGLDYPYSDRAGASSTSLALRISGTLNDDGFFLSEEARAAGFFHTDSSYPTSDLIIATLGIEALYYEYQENPSEWVFQL